MAQTCICCNNTKCIFLFQKTPQSKIQSFWYYAMTLQVELVILSLLSSGLIHYFYHAEQGAVKDFSMVVVILDFFWNLLFNSNHQSKQPSDLPFPGKPILSLIKKILVVIINRKNLDTLQNSILRTSFFRTYFSKIYQSNRGNKLGIAEGLCHKIF